MRRHFDRSRSKVLWDDFELQRIDIRCEQGETENSTKFTWSERNAGIHENGVSMVSDTVCRAAAQQQYRLMEMEMGFFRLLPLTLVVARAPGQPREPRQGLGAEHLRVSLQATR